MSQDKSAASRDFIREIIRADLSSGKHSEVITRFPPEPNGHLHIGHAKAICLNFSLADEFGGHCSLRFDDTNPETEETRFVDGIQDDVRWLGYDWGEHLHFASDYFEQLYAWAERLIEKGVAYVCSLDEEQIREYRGTVKQAGRPSPDRERPAAESLDLLRRMRAGEFPDGTYTLRAKIDMAHSNMKMRDPLLYRIRRVPHHRTGDAWSIYPMYDWAHGQSDAIEGVTHSLCTLEFENNRELYDWFIAQIEPQHVPRQYEFARLNLSHTVMSKRKLKRLAEEFVRGWDDPRMPTLSGLRRRGYPPEAIRNFCIGVGVAKAANVVSFAQLEWTVREVLNATAQRVMAVLKPLKVVIENYPEGQIEEVEAINNPEDESAGTRKLPFGRELWIEATDYHKDPPRKYNRLGPGREVRLKHAYFITCREAIEDPKTGEVVELRCTYDPETGGGSAPDGRRPKGTIHWVSAARAVDAEVRLYDHLFLSEAPEAAGDLADVVNPDSLVVLEGCKVEPSLADAAPGARFQFLRHGYFCADLDDGVVFNRTVSLRDTWAKIEKKLR